MLGRHHLLLSLFTAAVLLMPYAWSHGSFFVVMFVGVAVGSLVLDADSSDAAIFHRKIKGLDRFTSKLINGFCAPIFPLFGYVTKYGIYKPSLFILSKTLLKKYKIEEQHRGFLHTLLGITITTILTATYMAIIIAIINYLDMLHLIAFTAAYLFGTILHLLEDSATISGIQPNYPFSNIKLKGGLKTYTLYKKNTGIQIDKQDLFAGYIAFIALLVTTATLLEIIPKPTWQFTAISATLMIISWAIFLKFIAKVRIEKPETNTT